MELTRILTGHALRYPLMRPTDGVKLLYQNEFGCGHLVADPASALERLRAECAATPPDPAVPLLEDIGNGWVRVALAALEGARYSIDALNADFVRSAALPAGSMASFLDKLETLKSLTRQGLFAFSAEELDEYLADYLAAGCPPVSHSPQYRAAYHPAYRVVARACLSL